MQVLNYGPGLSVPQLDVLADYGAGDCGRGVVDKPPESEPSGQSEFLKNEQSEPSKAQSSEPQSRGSRGAAEVKEPMETSDEIHDLESKIHVRTLFQWRAKLPPWGPEPAQSVASEVPNIRHSNDQTPNAVPNAHPVNPNEDIEKALSPQVKRISRPESTKIASTDSIPRVKTKPVPQEITLHWNIEKNDGKETIGLNINRSPTKETRKDHLIWHHGNNDIMSIKQMETIVLDSREHGLPEDEQGLALRLLKRVQMNAERPFINGSFLRPYAHRYDGRHVSKEKVDTSCLFFNFPYICLKEPSSAAPKLTKGDPQHPVRTLLQSRFRLSKTTERDKHQSLKHLTKKVMSQYCKFPKGRDLSSRAQIKEKVFVPQLWGMILGEGTDFGRTMITNGPISEPALRGPMLNTSRAPSGLSIIRIRFESSESLVHSFPFHQCNSWFGLMKKQREVVERLRTPKHNPGELNSGKGQYEMAKAEKGRIFRPEAYLLYDKSGKPVLSRDWGDLLRRGKNMETLDLVMKYNQPDLKVDSANATEDKYLNAPSGTKPATAPDGSTSQPDQEQPHRSRTLHSTVKAMGSSTSKGTANTGQIEPPDTVGGSPDASLSPKKTRYSVQPTIPPASVPPSGKPDAEGNRIEGCDHQLYTPYREHKSIDKASLNVKTDGLPVPPFLEWPILDQFGEPSKVLTGQIVRRYLESVRAEHSVEFIGPAGGPGYVATEKPSDPSIGPPLYVRKVSFKGLTLPPDEGQSSSDEGKKNTNKEERKPSNEKIEAQEMLTQKCNYLLEMFVPTNDFTTRSGAVTMYWGAIFLLLNKLRVSDLNELSNIVSGIAWHAQRLKAGVHRICLSGDELIPATTTNEKQGMVLLETMVDAMREVFAMFVDAARRAASLTNETESIFVPDAARSAIIESAKRACKYLDTARDELIGDADVNMQGKNTSVGSLVTPETIMIVLMERLSHGVFEDRSVDFIGLYEECFQRLTQEVEHSASRRLLKKINYFQEEIDIVEDVLKQQVRILETFGELLNPDTYANPSGDRNDRYANELERIKKLRTEIKERLALCRELQERALRLATRNVQLVEASADNSNRAIVIFTFVTVLFLPLSFVASFFGINGAKYEFGVIAGWTTAGVIVFCIAVAAWGEQIWLALSFMPRKIKDQFEGKFLGEE